MVGITSEQMERVQLLLRNVQKGPERVFSNALNRGAQKARTEASKQIRAVYHVKAGEISNGNNVRIKRATPDDLVGEVDFMGTMIPLKKFSVMPSIPAQREVTAAVLKAHSGKRMPTAYVADLGLHGPGVFHRLTSARATSQQYYGPSVAHMAGKEQVITEVAEPTQELINKRVEHELSRILAGIGG